MSTWTARKIRDLKGSRRFSCLTATDAVSGRMIDEAGIELILVGDSLGMTVLGYETTLPVTMEDMLRHTAAVVRGVSNALVVADMPFMSYQVSTAQALENAGRFLKEAGAGAVKIEGGRLRVPAVKALVENGIPVLGHIGLTPQSIRELGSYRVQGRESPDAERLKEDAASLEEAGAFAVVLECVPTALGRDITARLEIPTIGIGAGRYCDAQVLVLHDMLGLGGDKAPRFVKRYADLGTRMREALTSYKREVEAGEYPDDAHSYE